VLVESVRAKAGVEIRLDYVELTIRIASRWWEMRKPGWIMDTTGVIERGVVGGKDEVDRQPHPR